MGNYFGCIVFQRILLPIIVCASIAIRPSAFSLIYLALVFVLPYIPVIEDHSTSKRKFTIYFSTLITTSFLNIIVQITFQTLWITETIKWSGENAKILRDVGIINLNNETLSKILLWTSADVVPFVTSIIIFILLKKLGADRKNEQELVSVKIERDHSEFSKIEFSEKRFGFLKFTGIISSLAAMCFSGAIFPSPVNFTYFASFIIFATFLSCNRKLFKKFAVMLKIISILLLLQMTMLILYQNPRIYSILKNYEFFMKMLGFDRILLIDDEKHFSDFDINSDVDLDMILHPAVLMVTYFVLITTANYILLSAKLMKESELRKKKRKPSRVTFSSYDSEKEFNKSNAEIKIESRKLSWTIEDYIDGFKIFFDKNAYIMAIFSMMIYSVIYHSWIGFTFLLTSNIICLLPNQGSKCKMLSPIILLYAIIILVINYIQDIRFHSEDKEDATVELIGLKTYAKYSFVHLQLKVILMLPYWILMQQKFQEKSKGPQQKINIDRENSFYDFENSKWSKKLKRCIIHVWMWLIVSFIFFIAALGTKMHLCRIINMSFVLIFLIAFQVSFKFWAKMMHTFCVALIIYAKTLLTLIYVFQFSNFPVYPILEFFGLYKYSTTALLLKLSSLTIISILCAIQLNYLHDDFLKIYEGRHSGSTESSNDENRKEKLRKKFLMNAKFFYEKLLIFIEIHFHKGIFIFAFLGACLEIQVMSFICIILLLFGGKSKTSWIRNSIINLLLTLFFSAHIILIMLYDLMKPFVMELLQLDGISLLKDVKAETLLDIEIERPIMMRILKEFTFIAITTAFSALKMRQFLHFNRYKPPKLMFENISRKNSDDSVKNLIKYLFNYGFYKFGIEVVLIAMLMLISTKMDLLSLLYIPLFFLFAFTRRRALKRVCRLTATFCLAMILIQVIGLGSLEMFNNQPEDVFKLLNLLFGELKRNPSNLVFDYILLITLSCQSHVFKKSRSIDFREDPFILGGENAVTFPPRLYNGKKIYKHRIYSFPDKIDSVMDLLKRFVFKIQFWMTIAVLFFAGTNRVDVFSLSYIICSFVFLWQGTEFFLKPLPKLLMHWNWLLAYNITAIVIKTVLETFVNILPHYCFLLSIFEIPCSTENTEKSKIYAKIGFFWDIIAFLFIIAQRRIFRSYYFFNIIQDTQITNMLASRGAKLIEELRIQEMNRSIEEEQATLDNLRERMENIKKKNIRNQEKRKKIKSHDLAIRTGDFYMFDDDFENDGEDEQEKSVVAEIEKSLTRISEPKISAENFEVESEESLESVEVNERFREKCIRFFQKGFKKIHEKSKQSTYIIKILNLEKKYLRDAMSSLNSPETDSSENLRLNSSFENYQRMFARATNDVAKQIRFEMRRISSQSHANLREEIEAPEGVSVIDFFREIFYFMVTHTRLLVYLMIFINQIASANILSIPLPLLIFFWGSLTFPRPSKFFWVLLIAYVKTVVILKCLAQLDLVWWDREHMLVIFFGINRNENFALYDLILLLALFLHRAVLKLFGLWKEEVEPIFHEGTFELDRCDPLSKSLIRQTVVHGIRPNASIISEDIIKPESAESGEILVSDSEVKIRKLFRHTFNDDRKEIDSVFKDGPDLIHAREEIFCDNKGRLALKIRQDYIKLRVRPINTFDSTKSYPVQRIVTIENEIEEPIDFYPAVLKMSFQRYASLTSSYLKGLFTKYRQPRKPVDMYKFMFLFEFVNFFVLVFGFSTFAIEPAVDETRSVLNYFEENRVPTSLLFLVIIQFAVIIIDRILYLRKFMTGKIIFHFCIIVTTHIWMFFVLPINSSRSFNSSIPPVIFYLIKCIYILVSSYQIRCGYPRRVLGNFLMGKFNEIHQFAYKAYLHIPFLFELRTVIDWLCIPTSLTLFEWIRIEAIHAQVYQIKCQRNNLGKAPRGVKKPCYIKLLQGGGLTLVIILILWFPMVFFAYSSALGNSNRPTQFSLRMQFVGYEPIYTKTLDSDFMKQLTEVEWEHLKRIYEKSPRALNFLEDFQAEDVVVIKLSIDSSTTWNLPPPNIIKLLSEWRNETVESKVSLTYEVMQSDYGRTKKMVDKIERWLDQETCEELADILEGKILDDIKIRAIFPKMFYIRNHGIVTMLSNDLIYYRTNNNDVYSDLQLKLFEQNGLKWWRIQEDCENNSYDQFPSYDCENFLSIYVFNEKTFPSLLSGFALKGVVGMYVTIMVVFWKILRTMIINFSINVIMVEELPNVDKILNLIQNIYMVREAGEFILEEDLVAKLYFLYRSPKTLIKFTKIK